MWVIAFIKQIIVEWVLFLFFTFTACAVQYARRNPYYLATLIDCVSSQMRVTRSYKSADLNQLWSRKILETTKSQLIVFSLSLLSTFDRIQDIVVIARAHSLTVDAYVQNNLHQYLSVVRAHSLSHTDDLTI